MSKYHVHRVYLQSLSLGCLLVWGVVSERDAGVHDVYVRDVRVPNPFARDVRLLNAHVQYVRVADVGLRAIHKRNVCVQDFRVIGHRV